MLKRKHAKDDKAQRHVRSKQKTDRANSTETTPLNGTDRHRWREPKRSSTLENGFIADEQGATQAGQIQSSIEARKLLDALNDFLHASSGEWKQNNTALDKDLLAQCASVRDSLEKQITNKPLLSSTSDEAQEHSISQDPRGNKHPIKMPSTSSLTPWNTSSIPSHLPPLPPITSSALETATFTHSSMTANQAALSYERLEWVGDAYLYLISTLLISSTFTTHGPGRCAQIRELLVKNETLATYARHYGFDKRARLPVEYSNNPNVLWPAKPAERTKVLGDIFEAYVAAVIMSDLDHGIDCVATWLRSLWAGTIAKQIGEQMRLDEKLNTRPTNDPSAKLHPKDILSQKILCRAVKIHYRDAGPETKDRTTGLLVFKVAVYLEGWGEKDKWLGEGSGFSKKEAGMKAAENALENQKLIARYGEKKRLFDEEIKVERERAALDLDGS